MRHKLVFLLLLTHHSVFAHHHLTCSSKPSLFQKTSNRLEQIWTQGKNELYLPTYAWHNRYQYSAARLRTFNEHPWGGGLGKSFYDEQGDWHGIYAFGFLDSHENFEPVLGYAFLKTLKLSEHTTVGGGYTVLVTARPDIMHNIPVPGVLPWVALSYQRASIAGTYIPGARGAGNVLFLVTKFLF